MRREIMMAALVLLLLVPLTVVADDFTMDLPDQTLKGDPGTEMVLGSQPVPEALQGQNCHVTAVLAGNNTSVHPGNNIRVDSATSVVLEDVEREPNVETGPVGPIEAGQTVTATLVFGSDGVYSAQLVLTFECEPEQTTTTTTVPDTTTTVPDTTTTVPDTTTTVPDTTTTTPDTTVPPSTLPRTGVEDGHLAAVAVVALLAGSALVIAARKDE